MKQNITRNLLSLSLLLSIFASHIGLATAQTSPDDAFNTAGRSLMTVPSNAVIGSTDERRNAYNGLSEAEKTQVQQKADELIKNAIPAKQEDKSINLTFADDSGNRYELSSRSSMEDSSDFSGRATVKKCPGCTLSIDRDQDGLLDSLENSLADGFTPHYFVSGGENTGTGFARFNNSVPQTVSQVYGSTPPISHFRVKPLGAFGRNDGITYGLVQITYLTLWNKDDGLVGSPFCVFQPVIDLTSLGNHNLDNEYSAVLLAAPMVNGNL